MTETDWLTDPDWTRHVRFVEPQLGPRRARLLAVAFCLARLPEFDDAGFRAALDTIARFADGDVTRDGVEETRSWARVAAVQAHNKIDPDDPVAAHFHSRRSEFAWALSFAAHSPLPLLKIAEYAGGGEMRALVWDVAGNPFRRVAFDPAWRTVTALTLARRMYETREFSAMPILADALQDAGCDNNDVLNHCRADGPHVRGCWVVDGLLGKV